MKTYNDILEFNSIKEMLSEYASSDYAKNKSMNLEPYLNTDETGNRMRETTEAKAIFVTQGNPPVAAMKDLNESLTLAEKGSMLIPDQLMEIALFINSSKRMKLYLKRSENMKNEDGTDNQVSFYGNSLYDLSALYDEINNSCKNGTVDDNASSELYRIRRKLESVQEAVKEKLNSILRNKKEYFSEAYITVKSGRSVLPVKKEYKNMIPGTLVEKSNTGGTFFIEPSAILKYKDEISYLQIEEENEVRKILYFLTAMVDENTDKLKINKECMEELDFIFAKAKLSESMRAREVPVLNNRKITINKGRHPLLDKEECVPLDFKIGGDIRGIVITGPNTGGKTVALKTVGLLSLMAQSGLHVPADGQSSFCMNANVLCDIGDGQSITENLSTFSAHIKNIVEILNNCTKESLVLLDELGSGTDPAEGMGIAVSILEELSGIECLFLATTHYPRIKEYADDKEGILNARMEFDRDTLKPLYNLRIGEAGESCAFHIARRLGFPEHMLRRADREAYGGGTAKENSDKPKVSSYKHNAPGITQNEVKKEDPTDRIKFVTGDSVIVFPEKNIGIVFKPADDKGMICVQINGKKEYINQKRLKLKASAKDLYPEDYDFSIIFDSVEKRKAMTQIRKGHNHGLMVNCEEDV